ncbi:MAG: hypothetical protein ABSG54_06565 [Terriglobia bacterium]
MRFKTLWAVVSLFALAVTASAQTKISGTEVCGKPDQQQMLEVGDHLGHMLGVQQVKCTWSKMEIEGSAAKDSLTTIVVDAHGSKANIRGYDNATLASGDKAFVRFQGAVTLKDGAVIADDGMWSFTGGTGKLKGLKGEGTYKGKGTPEGGETFEVEGEYTLPGK